MNAQFPYLRLGVNIDHVATIRNARGGVHPDPLRAAEIAITAGADGITAHLREDRRHISDNDIARLKSALTKPLNLEMAATPEMLDIALKHRPSACCLVPERRQEVTTEGGLDVAGLTATLKPFVAKLRAAGIRVSLFVNADPLQIEASQTVGADIVELHTGVYCEAASSSEASLKELKRLQNAAQDAASRGIEVHAGHGLSFETVGGVATIPQIVELNIGHFLIGEAVFSGLGPAIQQMRALMDAAREGIVN
ncbi:MAG: pyridoxine 5'-phosphate synthase [Chitinophagales bacterium]|nr:pyridoxine 5'-phosphate synthase [Hyphomicrobiales bacterium]